MATWDEGKELLQRNLSTQLERTKSAKEEADKAGCPAGGCCGALESVGRASC